MEDPGTVLQLLQANNNSPCPLVPGRNQCKSFLEESIFNLFFYYYYFFLVFFFYCLMYFLFFIFPLYSKGIGLSLHVYITITFFSPPFVQHLQFRSSASPLVIRKYISKITKQSRKQGTMTENRICKYGVETSGTSDTGLIRQRR